MKPEGDQLPTRSSLLQRVKNTDDQDSWREFYDIYRGLIFAFARKAGLTVEEAEEAVQETLIATSRHLPKFRYNPKVCSFKTWLLNLAQWRVKDQLRKRRRRGPDLHEETSEETASLESNQLETIWDEEWRTAWLQATFTTIKTEISPKQWQIFDLYVLKEWAPGDVARTLRVNIARVYLVKHRISALLKKRMNQLQKEAEPRK